MPQQRSRLSTAALAGSIVGVLALSSCAGGADPAAEGDSFSLAFAVTNESGGPYKALAEAYMQAHPDVEIVLNEVPTDSYGQIITTQLNGGNAPDVFQTSPGLGQPYSTIPLAEAGLLAPLTDEIAAAIPAGNEGAFQIDGETYGAALGLNIVAPMSNLTALEAAGVEFPTTWSDLLDTCAALTAEGKSLIAVAGTAPPNTALMAVIISATRVYAENPDWNAQRAANETTFVDSEGWRDTLQTIVDMNDAGCFQPGAQAAGFEGITNGLVQQTSMSGFLPSAALVDLGQAAPDAEFSFELFPAAEGGQAYAVAGANYSLSLAQVASENAAAVAFLEWTAGADGQAAWAEASNSLSPDADLSGTAYAPLADVISAGDYAPNPNVEWPNPAIYDALGTGVQGLLTGQTSIDDLLASLDAAWTR
jgi:raffinose/stachyose/melibiose transport system substrate-binding protein